MKSPGYVIQGITRSRALLGFGSALAGAWSTVILARLRLPYLTELLALASGCFLVYSAWRFGSFGTLDPDLKLNSEIAVQYQQASSGLLAMIRKADGLVVQEAYVEANMAYKRISDACLLEHSQYHPLYIKSLNSRAACLQLSGSVWSSRCLAQQSYELAMYAYPGANSMAVSHTSDLAHALQNCFEFSGAIKYAKKLVELEKAFNMKVSLPPGVSPLTPAVNRMANYLVMNGEFQGCLDLLKDVVDSDDPSVKARTLLMQATAMAYLRAYDKAAESFNRAQREIAQMSLDRKSPVYSFFLTDMIAVIAARGEYTAYPEIFGQYEGFVQSRWDEAEAARPTTIFLFETSRVALFKAHRRQFKESLLWLRQIIDAITPYPEQPFLWPCHAAAGAVLCWQHKYMEAEEHVGSALKFHKGFFGAASAEYLYTLALFGYILLARGQLQRAEICLKDSHAGIVRLPDVNPFHTLVIVQQLGLCYMCRGMPDEARAILRDVYHRQDGSFGAQLVSRRLTCRALGVLEALDGKWGQAAKEFAAGFDFALQINAFGNTSVWDSIGNIVGRWGFALALWEQGRREEALGHMKQVLQSSQARFGDDHKLSISALHDTILVEADAVATLQQLEALLATSIRVLGTEHNLTKKIKLSSQYARQPMELLSGSGLVWPERRYTVGNAAGRLPPLAEVDWLCWQWKEAHEDTSANHLTQTLPARKNAQPMIALPDYGPNVQPGWWEEGELDEAGIPRLDQTPDRRMPQLLFRIMTDLYMSLMIDFPRDFSPSFVETQYASSKEVPLEVCAELGRGGLSKGPVEKVRNPLTDEFFARKRLEYTRSVASRAKVHAEVSNMRKLAHPHIVKLCASYVVPSEGVYALLIQPVADCHLGRYMETCATRGFLREDQITLLAWLPCLTDALAYLHRREMKHRDIKPENILVKAEQVFFTDFGIAKTWATGNNSATFGQPGPGTRRYMAPEVVAWAEDVGRGKSSDVFSLGCVFAEMATVLGGKSVVAFERFRIIEFDEPDYSECVDRGVWMLGLTMPLFTNG